MRKDEKRHSDDDDGDNILQVVAREDLPNGKASSPVTIRVG